jgi:hypothetical protein
LRLSRVLDVPYRRSEHVWRLSNAKSLRRTTSCLSTCAISARRLTFCGDDMCEVKQRVGALETEVAQVNVRLAEVSNRIDRLANGVERIEQRLNLAEA